MKMRKQVCLYGSMVVLAALIVVADQWVKNWTVNAMDLYERRGLIHGFLGLYRIENTGASLGILQDSGWFLPIVSALAMLFILWVVARRWITHPVMLFSLAMVFGGAAGNLIDRVTLRYVVDMFEFLFVKFAIFNVADVFVVCGGILLCVCSLVVPDALPDFKKETESDAKAAMDEKVPPDA